MRGCVVSLAVAIAIACAPASAGAAGYAGKPARLDGLSLPARATATAVQLATPSGFADRFWPGVNLGATTPGHQPGEVSARAPEYRRWFKEMATLGVRVVRVYSLLDPSFYSELRRYNLAHARAPIYVIHGVWIPEDRFYATGNLWDAQVVREQKQLIDWVHAAVFGRLELKPRPGYAHGRWKADVSRWVIAWSPGVEWDPTAIQSSEQINAPREYDGKYISTKGTVSSSEAWIATMLDYMASLDAKAGWSRAMTFTNWLTADPLQHPYEPLVLEDSITIDAMHLQATPAWPGGLFASYHAYPYYPDFLSRTPQYANAPDPYGAYLRDLRAHHRGQALMITEFGVPASLGDAHLGPLGRDQGGHSEAEAGRMDAAMLDQMKQAGLAGGVLFEWIDEWFKFSWNTIDFDKNRWLWWNDLTNEQHFGVLAAEPGARTGVVIDGRSRDWKKSNARTTGKGAIRVLRAGVDPEGVNVLVSCRSAGACSSLRFGFDVRPGGKVPETSLTLDGKKLHAAIAAWTDPFLWRFGVQEKSVPVDMAALQPDSGVTNPPRMLLNRPQHVRPTGEDRPSEIFTLDPLPYGSQTADRRNLVMRRGATLEIRVPWTFLGYADPSSHLLIAPQSDGKLGTEKAKVPLRLQVFDRSGGALTKPLTVRWRNWAVVRWHERRKGSWPYLKRAFSALAK